MDANSSNGSTIEHVPVRREVTDYDSMREYIVGSDLEYIKSSSLTVGTAEMMTVALPGVVVEAGKLSWANVTRGSTSRTHTSFVMAPAAKDTHFNGAPSGPGFVHAWGPNTDLLDSAPPQTGFTAVSIETETLERSAAILDADHEFLAPGVFKTYSGEMAEGMLRATESFVNTALDVGGGGVPPAVATRFGDSIVAHALDTIGRYQHAETPVRIGRLAALETVIACDEYASARRYQGITTLGLSRAAWYSERRVRAAFKEVTGVSPMHFMRLRALHEIRRELLSGAAESVSDAAFKWGLTELGRFARAYSDLFGELPSETLRAGGHRWARAGLLTP